MDLMSPPVKTHCKRGHEFTAENTYLSKVRRWEIRQCKRCRALGAKQRYHSEPEYRAKVRERARRHMVKRRDDARQRQNQDVIQSS
jgi:hypothetical protein